jgi:hypothetical protein
MVVLAYCLQLCDLGNETLIHGLIFHTVVLSNVVAKLQFENNVENIYFCYCLQLLLGMVYFKYVH